ncbi:SRPBCC family protein [Amycolatopsis endophytica]|uniref:Polyketide cyclase n=1 Tax=Amycolatopsis endophytica TaxID=860233 RepID=A0A853BEE6_9PSEU|nr:SRPBCC family protein [Amycolatopsis endophytica]NYI93400.1 hypothetical protein [Amycolatopsis endophytica]
MTQAEPGATGRIEIGADPARVYRLVSDPGVLAELSEEYTGFRWLGGNAGARVGARFRGVNRRGLRRWSTVSTITDADEGRRFAFEVRSMSVIPVSRWQYDFAATGEGCVVTESTWDRRPGWFRFPSALATGGWRRAADNRVNIATTLRRLKERAERD